MGKEISAAVFNVQFFSLHDGPGIRTCVFVKGCPLSCRWCANPESQSPEIEELRDAEKCLGCGACAARLPLDTRAKNCPAGAVTISGEVMTARAAAEICLRDTPFYEESGGGVTITGGEPLTHADFTAELIDILKSEGIDTAIETSGFAGAADFEKVASRADRILFDVKHFDSKKHAEFTGVPNEIILANLARAKTLCENVLPRVPVIPFFNADAAEGIARAIADAGYRRAQLMAFHRFGEHKYALLGKKYAYEGVKPPSDAEMAEYVRAFARAGVDAFI